MNYKSTLRKFLTAAALTSLLAPLVSHGQSAPKRTVPYQGASDAAMAKRDASNAIELSPFVVNTSKDDGFMATNAGTATKLGLDMKDMAAPYSVMTGEFLSALGITDLQTAVEWSTNGSPVIDGQGADQFMVPVMYNSRGIILNAGQQRNFFPTSSATDTYNVERIDFGRGPNAVLFNSAANSVLGGGISTVGKRPRVDQRFADIGLTVGSFNYIRSTLDYNQPLTSKLAIRVNAMKHSKDGWLNGAMEKRKGITFSALYKPTSDTDIWVETYSDRLDRTNTSIPILDNLSGWDGVTTFDAPITKAQFSSNATPGTANYLGQTLTYNGEPNGINRLGTDYVYIPGSGTVENWQYMGTTRRGDETNRTPIYGDGQVWSRNGNTLLLPFGNSSNQNLTPGIMDNGTANGPSILYSINLPGDRFNRAIKGSKFTIPGKQFTNSPTGPMFTQFTKDINLGLNHEFTDNLFMEVAMDYNVVLDKSVNTINGFRNTFVDINKNLPDGSPNPNFLEPYAETLDRVRQMLFVNKGARANLSYILRLGRWGNYTFNFGGMYFGLYHESRQRVASIAQYSDPRAWMNQAINTRLYWNAPSRNLVPEDVGSMSFFNRVADTTGNSFATTSSTITPRWVINGADNYDKSTKSVLAATSARYFHNKLVLTLGSREDWNDVRVRYLKRTGSFPNDPNWDGNTLTNDYWRPDAPADWRSLTYIPLDSKGNPTSTVPILAASRPTVPGVYGVNPVDPRYNNYRFRDDYNNPERKSKANASTIGAVYHLADWISFKANYGANTMARDSGTWDMSDNDAKPETGVAYEAAMDFSLFNDRLVVTPRYYYNVRENILGDFPGKSQINSLLARNAWNDGSLSGWNQLGLPKVEEQDYYAYRNTGYELEIAGRITQGWRLSASLGTTQGVTFDRWQNTQPFIRAQMPAYKQVLEAAGGIIDTTQKNPSAPSAPGLAIPNPAITDAQINAAGGSTLERIGAVNDYNAIWVQYDTITSLANTVGVKRLTFKILTDYTIQSGTWKGLRFGFATNYTDNTLAGYRSADTIANPNYNAGAPISSTNLPYADDPSVNANTAVWVKNPIEVTGTFGYSRHLTSGPLKGKDIRVSLIIRNLMNWQKVVYQDTGLSLRPPNGNISLPYRVSTPSRVARYQQPISWEMSVTLRL